MEATRERAADTPPPPHRATTPTPTLLLQMAAIVLSWTLLWAL